MSSSKAVWALLSASSILSAGSVPGLYDRCALNGCCDKFRAGETYAIEVEALLPPDEVMDKGDVVRELKTMVEKGR